MTACKSATIREPYAPYAAQYPGAATDLQLPGKAEAGATREAAEVAVEAASMVGQTMDQLLASVDTCPFNAGA